jgi:Flavodoxins
MKKTFIIVYSYHHGNTAKIANVMAEVLNAEVKSPQDIKIDELSEYDLIGFGAGIDSGKHYAPLLELADKLQITQGQNAFIFSTSGVGGKKKTANDHKALRGILLSKGYKIVDEFACLGLDTNSVLKYIGGLNKGRPNEADFQSAVEFANKLL